MSTNLTVWKFRLPLQDKVLVDTPAGQVLSMGKGPSSPDIAWADTNHVEPR